MMSRFRKQMAHELSIGAQHPLQKSDDAIQDVMEHHSVNEDDDDIESGSTSSLNSDTDSNDFLVPEYENPGPDPDDLGAPSTCGPSSPLILNIFHVPPMECSPPTLHHRVPSLKSQSEMWAPPSTATVQFHTYNPSGILFYQINSVMTDFLGLSLDPTVPKPSTVVSGTGYVVLFEQASNTFYVTLDTVHAAAITAAIVPLLTMKVYFEGFPSTSSRYGICNPLQHVVLSPPEWYLAPDGFDAVSVQNVGSTYIIVSWDLPTHSNGILINFSLYCNGALAGVLPLTVISFNTTGLLPFTLYMYIQPAQHEEDSPPGGPPDPELDTDDIVISVYFINKITNPDKSFGSSRCCWVGGHDLTWTFASRHLTQGVVTAMSGPVSMVIQLEDGQAVRRHTDHVKARSTTPEPQVPKKTTAVQQDEVVDLPDIQEEAATREEEGPPMVDIPVPLADAVIQAVPEPIPNLVPLRRSTSLSHVWQTEKPLVRSVGRYDFNTQEQPSTDAAAHHQKRRDSLVSSITDTHFKSARDKWHRDCLFATSCKAPIEVTAYLAGGNLTALNKSKPGCPFDVRPGPLLWEKPYAGWLENASVLQLRDCIEQHWLENDFVVLKVELKNAFNMVSRQAVLNECGKHFPELLPWASWCYSQHPFLWHPLGCLTSEQGVQQGDPLGPLLFSLVLNILVSDISSRGDCSLNYHAWYLDDGALAGPGSSVYNILAMLQELGPPLDLHVNIHKCEVFSHSSLDLFPAAIKKSHTPNLDILGSPIGDAEFCHHYIAHKQLEAQSLLSRLDDVGLIDPQVALTLLRMCGGFCRLVHLARTTPPSLSHAALQLYDQDVRRCFSSCTAVDTSDVAWKQSMLGLSKGGLGLRSLHHHAPAAYIASVCSSGFGSKTNDHLCSAVAYFNPNVPPDMALQIDAILSAPSVQQNKLSSMLDTHMFNLISETHGAWGKEAVEAFSQLASRLATHTCRLKSAVTFELYSRLNLHLVEVGYGSSSEERHTRPADVLAANWMMGKPAAFDFTVTSPLTSSNLPEASVTAGSAAFAAEERKHKANDSKCAELGWVCIPIAVETYGCWGTEAKWALSQLASHLATRQNCPKSASVTALYQRLSMTLVRANVRALLSRTISDAGY
eukprot:Em0002g1438a